MFYRFLTQFVPFLTKLLSVVGQVKSKSGVTLNYCTSTYARFQQHETTGDMFKPFRWDACASKINFAAFFRYMYPDSSLVAIYAPGGGGGGGGGEREERERGTVKVRCLSKATTQLFVRGHPLTLTKVQGQTRCRYYPTESYTQLLLVLPMQKFY